MKEKLKKTAKRIFFLSPVLTVLIAIFSFSFMIAALTGRVRAVALEYLSYMLSAYALVISVIGIARLISFARNGLSAHPFVNRVISVPIVEKLIHEKHFRTEIALYPGFCMNAFYAIFKTATGIYYRSAWFLSLGVYYLALAMMRFVLIHYIRVKKQNADRIDELRRYRICGYMLFLINVAIAGITILVVKRNQGFTYPGYLIYVMAMYAFYSVITAVVNLVKYRKYDSPILSAAKVINMSTALVSIFSLETAMLAQFGEKNAEYFRVMMTGLTGAGVSLIVVGMAVFMIVRADILIKRDMEDGK